MNNNDLFLGFASNCSRSDLACSRQSKSEQEVPVYDLCRGSAEVCSVQRCKCQKRRRMSRFFRNAKVPTGAEEAN